MANRPANMRISWSASSATTVTFGAAPWGSRLPSMARCWSARTPTAQFGGYPSSRRPLLREPHVGLAEGGYVDSREANAVIGVDCDQRVGAALADPKTGIAGHDRR